MKEILEQLRKDLQDEIHINLIRCNSEKEIMQARFEGYKEGVFNTISKYEKLLENFEEGN